MGAIGYMVRALSRCLPTILLGCFLLGWQAVARAQTTEAAAASVDMPQVAVGDVTGIPGAIVLVPLYYTANPDLSLRSLTVEIDYISNSLEFQRASAGLPLKNAEADLETTLLGGTADEKGISRSKLRVKVSLPDTGPSEILPEGLLAYLTFLISLDAKPFAINLNPLVVSAEEVGDSLQASSKVAVQPGTVAVQVGEVTPLAGCFFFMH